MAVAHPCDDVSLEAAVEAARLHLIEPILVGPADRIRRKPIAPDPTSAAWRSSTSNTATTPPRRLWNW